MPYVYSVIQNDVYSMYDTCLLKMKNLHISKYVSVGDGNIWRIDHWIKKSLRQYEYVRTHMHI